MFGTLALGLSLDAGAAPALRPAAPAITVVEPVTNPPDFWLDLPSGNVATHLNAAVGDTWLRQIAASDDPDFTTILDEASAVLDSDDLTADIISAGDLDTVTAGTRIARARLERPDVGNSAWSATTASFEVPSAVWTPADLGADLALWLEADDLTTLFQSNAGSTAVSADGQSVGYWGDKSGDGFHLTSTADDGTRPVYNTAGGLHWVTFDGTDAKLRRTADLGLYAAGACSVFVALRGATGTTQTIMAPGNSGSANQRYDLLRWNHAATRAEVLIRTDANATLAATELQTPSVWDGADRVFGVTDSGSLLTSYLDGTAIDTASYTRSGTFTFNNWTVGAITRTSLSDFLNARLYAVVAVNRVLTTEERESLTTYLGAKAGLTL